MVKKEWAIIAVLATAVVIVFACLGCLVLAMLVTSSSPASPVVQLVITATPEQLMRGNVKPTDIPPMPTRQLIVPPTLTNIPRPINSDANVFLKERQCISKGDTVLCLVTFNNLTDSIVDYVGVTFHFYDSDGVSLGNEYGGEYNLFPKETRKAIVRFYLPDNTKLGKYEFDVSLSGGSRVKIPGITQNPFTVSGVQIQDDNVVAIIANSSDKVFDSVQVCVVLYDKNGAFVGGGYSVSPLLPARGKARVEVSYMWGVFGVVSKAEVYPSTWLTTSVK